MRNGLTLETVIFDRRNNKFSVYDSDFFWFTVLRKLYIYSCDPAKEESHQNIYKNLAGYLEENLYKDCATYGQIARTAKLFLEVENGGHHRVEDLLKTFQTQLHFHKHMRVIPGMIFPIGSFYEEVVHVTPVALALRQRDIRMVNLLCKYRWGKQTMFKVKNMQMKLL